MTQKIITTSAIVLRTIDVKENDLIILLFTRQLGLVRGYIAGGRSRNHPTRTASQPLTEAEWILKPAKEELFFPKEASLSRQNLHLRSDLSLIQSACAMLKSTERALPEGDPAPEVYDLLQLFLTHLGESASPSTVSAIYNLKLMLYQGVLGEEDGVFLQDSEIRSLAELLSLTWETEKIQAVEKLFEERFLNI